MSAQNTPAASTPAVYEAVSEILYKAAASVFGKRQVESVDYMGEDRFSVCIEELVYAATNQAYDDVTRFFRFQVRIQAGTIEIRGEGRTGGMVSKTAPIDLWVASPEQIAEVMKGLTPVLSMPAGNWECEDDTPSLQETHSWAYTEW